MKYNVGSKLVIIKEEYGHGFDIGTEVVVIEKTSYDYCVSDGDNQWYVKDNEVEAMSKFNKGDKVVWMDRKSELYSEEMTVGMIYTVVNPSYHNYADNSSVIVKDSKGSNMVHMLSSNFDLVVENDSQIGNVLLSISVADKKGNITTLKRSKCRHYYIKSPGVKQKRVPKKDLKAALVSLAGDL